MIDGNEIRAARKERGWSQGKLAEEASRFSDVPVSQQAVARIEGGSESKHKLSVLRALGLVDQPAMPAVSVPKNPPPREVELAPDAPPFEELGGRREIQVLGISVGGEDGDFSMNGEVVELVPRPRGLVGRQIFAVRVAGTSMEPRFDEGDLLYVERNREPAIGEDGVFEMKPTGEWEAGRAFVKQLVSKGAGNVTVRQFNPDKPITYRRDEIKQMYRIVPRNELHGV